MTIRLTLEHAAEYVRSSRAPRMFMDAIALVRRVFTFTQERGNRLRRYIEVVRAYKRGDSVQSIQNKYGCSRWTVLRYARLAGEPKRDRAFDPKVRRGVIAMYQQDKPVAEIAARFGVSEAYVSKTAREEGISRYAPRPKSKPSGRAATRRQRETELRA